MINNSTGTEDLASNYMEKLKIISFDKYEITIKLDERDRFMGIVSIGFNKDFMEARHKRKFASSKDVYSYYPVENEN